MGTGRRIVVTLLGVAAFMIFGFGFLWWYDRTIGDISFFRILAWGIWIIVILCIVGLIAAIARGRRR